MVKTLAMALVGAAVVIVVGSTAVRAGDAFVCYAARGAAATAAGAVVDTADEAAVQRALRVGRANAVCAPADVGDGVADADTHLRGYRSRMLARSDAYAKQPAVKVSNELGDLFLDVEARPRNLLVPAAVGPAATPPDPALHDLDHYRCHGVRGAEFAGGTTMTVGDGLGGNRDLILTRVKQLCTPVAIDGSVLAAPAKSLLCYGARRARGSGAVQRVRGLGLHDSFGAASVDTAREIEVCLPSRAVARCNGHRDLCDRGFDEIAHPTTHNSMSNAEEGWLGPNQRFSITRQLDDGVRGLMLDTWYFNLQPVLCHGGNVISCEISGMKPLADGLVEITDFLDRRPNEVATIIFESYITQADTAAAFAAADLLRYVHVQSPGDPWPTMRELIEADTRLVVFTDNGSASLPWHHYVWHHAWETHYSFQNPSQFSCNRNRGSLSNPLFILNHFLTNVIGSPALAEQVNYNPLFIDRALQCQAESGRLPNFVTVDFHDIGDLFAVVDELNGV